ncbi:HAD family hydrolase [Maribacter sp. HTCC2170]|uniref:HAD family hydrolase n=1 Tax=Maribacter sp. (strain HTCC2170 / KCCM 42371) TaxID=313603 RepID=UPI00006B222A|nr:HAD family phosphatase [Maribacter sp. HTCC2170]EAR00292.1 hydrolase, haloacid dehalogenase-like family protein [Maribacter sp. HTCC2170]
MGIDTIIFDLGGVLIDWNPKYVYRDVFDGDEQKVEWFLNDICTSEWNVAHDAGRPLDEGTELLVAQYPEYEEWIRMYYDRWPDMLGGPISETVDLLYKLKQQNTHNLYALTNWSGETFPVALQRFEFLKCFEGIVVSGTEKTRKPFQKIYDITLERYNITPEKAVFIDDNLDNVNAAINCGIKGIHFKNANQLTRELKVLNVSI